MAKRVFTQQAQKITPEVLPRNPLLRRLIHLRAAQVREKEAATPNAPDQGTLF